MHLPDGVLPASQWVPLAAVAGGVVTAAGRHARRSLEGRRVPVVGFLAAAVLVLQMVNFPLVGSASGHLTGTTLLVFAAGVDVAAVAMASVLLLQALLFQDGGLLAIGANYVNMVAVPALIALPLLAFARRRARSPRAVAAAAFVAALLGCVAGALSCALQLVVAGVAPTRMALGLMGGGHALIGVIEGALTAVSVGALARRGLAAGVSERGSEATGRARAGWVAPVLALAVLAALLVPLASRRPDVLETLLRQATHSRAAR